MDTAVLDEKEVICWQSDNSVRYVEIDRVTTVWCSTTSNVQNCAPEQTPPQQEYQETETEITTTTTTNATAKRNNETIKKPNKQKGNTFSKSKPKSKSFTCFLNCIYKKVNDDKEEEIVRISLILFRIDLYFIDHKTRMTRMFFFSVAQFYKQFSRPRVFRMYFRYDFPTRPKQSNTVHTNDCVTRKDRNENENKNKDQDQKLKQKQDLFWLIRTSIRFVSLVLTEYS